MSIPTATPRLGIPIFTTVKAMREWRHRIRRASPPQSVGFVATMGALHDGHLSLLKRSLAANEHTVLSIFINPTQFAPHEDLSTYPRTLERDLDLIESVSLFNVARDAALSRRASAVFVPTANEMYPSGVSQVLADQRGTFIQVKGFEDEMEGKSRPGFFRGVATVVTKLFNVVEPDHTYFGQKDIQQALLLRRLCADTLLSHPAPENLHIVPTARDPTTGLALSSRNAYLNECTRLCYAPALYDGLQAAKSAWEAGKRKEECIAAAREVVETATKRAATDRYGAERGQAGVLLKLDYVEMNDVDTLEVVSADETASGRHARGVILSGALWVNKTRLIDNILLGEAEKTVLS